MNFVVAGSFFHWTFDMFTQFCILCGCDYLPSIKGVGPKKAHALMHENRTIENVLFLHFIAFDLSNL
jgi:5'-3' exonuclease